MIARVSMAGLIAGVMVLTSSATASAQALGVRGGVNVSTIKHTPPEALGLDVTAELGATGGAFVSFHDASKLSFEVGGQLSMRRVGFGPDIIDKITYLEVPALARYAFVRGDGMTVRALGGGSMNFRLAASETVSGESSSATDAFKPLEFAIVIGAQAEWKHRWLFEGRFLYGLSDAYEVTVGGIEARQQGFQILVGYRLR